MASPATKPSTPRPSKLSEVARHLCLPEGIETTGFPAVRDRCAQFGITFDPWQDALGRAALGKRTDGSYAASVGGVVVSIPRQTGKTYLFGWLVFALCTLIPNLTVVWTAHRTRTSDETFAKMRSMAMRKKVAPYILRRPRSSNGQQAIEFKNGSRILFGAREQGFGRGFDMVDILVLDEAQILTESAMTDMVPATNAAPNGLVLMMGTPPRPKDPGEVFKARRADALAGDPDTLYVEFSAERGAKIIDWGQVAIANPSYPDRTGKTAILRMQKLLGSDINFYREAYGIWDDDTASSRLIPADKWSDAQVTDPPIDGIRCLGVVFGYDRAGVAIGGAVKHAGGTHLELVDEKLGDVSIDALADWLAARWRTVAMIALAGGAQAKVLWQALQDRNVPDQMLHVCTLQECQAANIMMFDGTCAGVVSVPAGTAEDALNKSVEVCDKKATTTGWFWVPTTPNGDPLPLNAVSLALWAARTTKRHPVGDGQPGGRVGGGRAAGRR